MTVGNQTAVPAGGTFTVNVAATDPNGDPIRYNLMFSDKHITGDTGFATSGSPRPATARSR